MNINHKTEKNKAAITGLGVYLPAQVVRSNELMRDAQSKKFGVSEEFLGKATGIHERRFSTSEETYDFLATAASRDAISDSGIDPLDIDVIIFCGMDCYWSEPSTAHHVQAALGASNAVCFDVSNACLGMMNGFSLANLYIQSGAAENILLCTGEKPSKLPLDSIQKLRNSSDKSLFRKLLGSFTLGDAGAAMLVSKASPSSGCIYTHYSSNSTYRNHCYYVKSEDGIDFEMRMEEISSAMVTHHALIMPETYENVGWNPSEIAKVYCHQVGKRPHEQMIDICGVDESKVPITYDKFGNLASATMAVNMALNPPKINDRILILGAGSGATMCQVAIVC